MNKIQFDVNGNPYPYDIITLTLEEFQKIFVDNLENIQHRKYLFQNLQTYLNKISEKIKGLTLWILLLNGSFTTKKEFPNDIDFVNLINYEVFEKQGNLIYQFTTFYNINFKNYDIRKHWCLDAYIVPLYPEEDERFQMSLIRLKYWVTWFGYDRNCNKRAVFLIFLKEKNSKYLQKIISLCKNFYLKDKKC